VTVGRPHAAAARAADIAQPDAIESPLGADAYGFASDAVRRDRIDLTPRAQELIAAGLRAHAFVIAGAPHQTIRLDHGRSLILESGLYTLR
jgi:hypothetical protein